MTPHTRAHAQYSGDFVRVFQQLNFHWDRTLPARMRTILLYRQAHFLSRGKLRLASQHMSNPASLYLRDGYVCSDDRTQPNECQVGQVGMENVLVEFYTVALYCNELFWKERKAQRIAGAADDDIRLYPAVIGKNHLLALKPCNLRFDED